MLSDHITFVIPWNKFKFGTSVFVPCLDPGSTLRAFRKEANIKGVRFKYRIMVENGIQGLRFWRM